MTKKIIGKDYLIEKYLDNGQTSQVFLVKHIQKETLHAAKVYLTHSDLFDKEIEILKSLSLHKHPGIINLYSYGDEPIIKDGIPEKDSKQYIIMDYLPNNSLFNYIDASDGLDEGEAKLMFYKILKAVEHCNKCGICHRDLKSDNILLDENNDPILCDFGVSCFINESEKFSDNVGTYYYQAPEIREKKSYDAIKSDIFSLGVVLFTMVFHKFCFFSEAKKSDKLYKFIFLKKYNAFWNKLGETIGNEKINSVSEEYKKLIVKMLAYNPDERPSIENIFNDDWMKDV